LLVPIDEVQVRGAIEPIRVPTEACNGINGRDDESEEEEEEEEEEENRGLIDMVADASRAASPMMWETSTANTMFYRSRPRPSE